MNKKLLHLICCPSCKGDLKLKQKSLVCVNCKLKYKIKNGVPILLVPKGELYVRSIYSDKDVAKNFGLKQEYTGSVKVRNILRNKTAKEFYRGKGILLDVGCGNGLLLEKICKLNKNLFVIGLDISEAMINESKKRLKDYENICFVIASATNLPFNDKMIDFCSCIDTLKNLKPKVQHSMIDELLRVTNKILVIEVLVYTILDSIISYSNRLLKSLGFKQQVIGNEMIRVFVKKLNLNKLIKKLKNNSKRIKVKSVVPLLNWKIIKIKC